MVKLLDILAVGLVSATVGAIVIAFIILGIASQGAVLIPFALAVLIGWAIARSIDVLDPVK